MRTRVLSALFVFLLMCSVVPALAEIRLEFQGGFVTLDAKNVTVRQILAEWSRLGGTKIVNGDRIVGSPVTLQLVHVPERQALEVILRSVSGYMAAPRLVANSGASVYDRILVMPTSSAPMASAAPRPASPPPVYQGGYPGGYPSGYPGSPGGFGQAAPRPGVMPPPVPGQQVPPAEADEQSEPLPPEEDEPAEEGEIAPAPVPPVVTGGVPQPGVVPAPGMVPPQGYPPNTPPPPTTAPAPSPGAPGGAAPTPGVIVQPQQPNPSRPQRP